MLINLYPVNPKNPLNPGSYLIPVHRHTHTMKPATGPRKLCRWHQDKRILHFLRVEFVLLKLVYQFIYLNYREAILFKSLHCFIIAIIAYNNALFHGQQIT